MTPRKRTERLPAAVSIACLAGLLTLTLLGTLLLLPPIAQPQSYHQFADQRALGALPHAANVLSSLPFLLVGGLGLRLGRRPAASGFAWQLFFLCVACTGPGSAYYHWSPNDVTLSWDRLPMSLGFMALLTALVCEHVATRRARPLQHRLLPALLLLGLGSVLYWRYSGDLRLYLWVQLAPLLCIPLLLGLWPGRYSHRYYLGLGLFWYALAKLCEYYDQALYTATQQFISGHTLKHLLAALAIYTLYRMLRQRHCRLPIVNNRV